MGVRDSDTVWMVCCAFKGDVTYLTSNWDDKQNTADNLIKTYSPLGINLWNLHATSVAQKSLCSYFIKSEKTDMNSLWSKGSHQGCVSEDLSVFSEYIC